MALASKMVATGYGRDVVLIKMKAAWRKLGRLCVNGGSCLRGSADGLVQSGLSTGAEDSKAEA